MFWFDDLLKKVGGKKLWSRTILEIFYERANRGYLCVCGEFYKFYRLSYKSV